MILQILLWTLLGYVAYRFIFGFVIPLYRTSRQIRQQVRNFRNHMQQQQQQEEERYSNRQHTGAANSKSSSSKAGEYIDFEEVK